MPKGSSSQRPRMDAAKSFEELALLERGRIRARMTFRRFMQQGVAMAAQQIAREDFDPSEIGEVDLFNFGYRRLPAITIQTKREQEQKSRTVQLLMQIDGIGPILAERLYDEFGSLEAIAVATPDRLALVEGIGDVRLRLLPKQVWKIIHSSRL